MDSNKEKSPGGSPGAMIRWKRGKIFWSTAGGSMNKKKMQEMPGNKV